ncbi:hypothetical protein GCM10009634_86610 [Saccharothrix xinjiangensis]
MVWAVLRFGWLVWLGDEGHRARPVVEGLSWAAGIGGLLVGVGALVVAMRQGRATVADVPAVVGSGSSQTVSDQGVILNGGVSGSGSGPTVGVNFGQIGGTPPDPSSPARG